MAAGADAVECVPVARPAVADHLADVDWSAHPVVDVVEYLPATSLGMEDDAWRTEVYRYEDVPPPPSVYGSDERRVRVQRVTRPLAVRLGGE